MRTAILFLILSLAVGLVGFFGVAERMEAVIQLAFFCCLVVFVVLMVRHLAQDRL